ncbi:hypothetical protein Pelo_486 [Pelomyxa schiedti]|nr:hypothetical protein Pelo_486 [Pelomyxa schiedti]
MSEENIIIYENRNENVEIAYICGRSLTTTLGCTTNTASTSTSSDVKTFLISFPNTNETMELRVREHEVVGKGRLKLPDLGPNRVDIRRWLAQIKLLIKDYTELQVLCALALAAKGEAVVGVITEKDGSLSLQEILQNLVNCFDIRGSVIARHNLENFRILPDDDWNEMICRFKETYRDASGGTLSDFGLMQAFSDILPPEWADEFLQARVQNPSSFDAFEKYVHGLWSRSKANSIRCTGAMGIRKEVSPKFTGRGGYQGYKRGGHTTQGPGHTDSTSPYQIPGDLKHQCFICHCVGHLKKQCPMKSMKKQQLEEEVDIIKTQLTKYFLGP